MAYEDAIKDCDKSMTLKPDFGNYFFSVDREIQVEIL